MKIENIEDMEKLFNEGKLTHIIVNDKCKNINDYAYEYNGRKVKIQSFAVFHVGFETDENTRWYIKFCDVNIEETEKLIKGENKMTKSDLKDGMVVVIKGEKARFMLNGCLIDSTGFVEEFKDDDILEVYKSKGQYFGEILSNKNLIPIWKKEGLNELEIELNKIEKQIEELQKSAKKIREEIGGSK